MESIRLTPGEIAQVSAFMRDICGNDFSDKEYLIGSKMGLLCSSLGYTRFFDLWDEAHGTTMSAAKRRQQIIDALTTNYSYFYREERHFACLAELVRNRSLPVTDGPLRIWSVGCATGEEPYNIAMALEDARREGFLARGYHIVASDISSKAIAAAERGCYEVSDFARLPSAWRTKYCFRTQDGCEVKGMLRENVEFRLENVLEPRPDKPFDAIWCRNMLIYFSKPSIKRLCTTFSAMVRPGGYLFLGHAEILGDIDGFVYVEPSVWKRKGNPEDNPFCLPYF